MTRIIDEVAPWDDPLDSVVWDHWKENGVLPADVAPIFCDTLGRSVYMVRKYFRPDCPIVPGGFRFVGSRWHFDPTGPVDQDDLIELERKVSGVTFFKAYWEHSGSRFHRLARIERVLRWVKANFPTRVAALRRATAALAPKADLASADDLVVESIVAFLVAACAKLPASAISFIPRAKGNKSPEFRVLADGLSATLEVKHVLKYPQSDMGLAWFFAFKRENPPAPKAHLRPENEVIAEVSRRLEQASHGDSAQAAALPWQKPIDSLRQQIAAADEQLGTADETGCKLIVLYSDDPHLVTETRDPATGEVTIVNRIDAAATASLPGLKHAHGIAVLAHPCGYPIESGHRVRLVMKEASAQPVAARLFAGLGELAAGTMEHFATGFTATLEPGGTGTFELRVS